MSLVPFTSLRVQEKATYLQRPERRQPVIACEAEVNWSQVIRRGKGRTEKEKKKRYKSPTAHITQREKRFLTRTGQPWQVGERMGHGEREEMLWHEVSLLEASFEEQIKDRERAHTITCSSILLAIKLGPRQNFLPQALYKMCRNDHLPSGDTLSKKSKTTQTLQTRKGYVLFVYAHGSWQPSPALPVVGISSGGTLNRSS